MQRCIRVIEKGFGMPAFKNDEIVVPALMLTRRGDGRTPCDYSAIGCIEVAVPGKWGYRCTGMSFLNLMRVLLAAPQRTGTTRSRERPSAPGDGSLEDFASFDELWRAWTRQIRFYTKATVAIDTAVDTALEENVPDILCSTLVDHCIERGKTLKEGGAKYDFISGLQVGIANLGNALAAVRKLVFDEKRITRSGSWRRLPATSRGWKGRRSASSSSTMLQSTATTMTPWISCFGMPMRSSSTSLPATTTHVTAGAPSEACYYAGTSSISANVPSGSVVPATPDGRKAWTPVAEGCSPSSGTDQRGPTAVFKSVAKLPTERICGGVLLNQKLSPSALRTDQDRRKLEGLLRAFFDELHGWHVQYNIVSRQTLLAAQKDPESYRDLVVRVAGYSALFTILAPETQNDIIARTEHGL